MVIVGTSKLWVFFVQMKDLQAKTSFLLTLFETCFTSVFVLQLHPSPVEDILFSNKVNDSCGMNEHFILRGGLCSAQKKSTSH